MNKTLGLLAIATMLSGCASDVSRPIPHYAYSQLPPVQMNVASIEVQELYQMPMHEPNAEHLMPQPLPKSVEDYAHTRFAAAGSTGTMVIKIKDASVMHSMLPVDRSLGGKFKVEQAEKYEAKVSIEYNIMGTGHETILGNVNVTKSQTVGEDISPAERDVIFSQMLEQVMAEVDASSQKVLTERLPFAVAGGSAQ